MLDELVSELRVANGQPRFELNLVATIGPPPVVPLLPAPSFAESVDQAFAAAEHSADSSERMTLLEAISKSLDTEPNAPEAWHKAARAKVTAALEIERDLDTRYGSLVRRSLARADERASQADVRGIETIVKKALADDDRLGRRRPNQMSSLLAGLDQRLESARRLRAGAGPMAGAHQGISRVPAGTSVRLCRRSSVRNRCSRTSARSRGLDRRGSRPSRAGWPSPSASLPC